MKRNVYYTIEKISDSIIWFNTWDEQGNPIGLSSSKRFNTRKSMEKFMKRIGGKFEVLRWSFKNNQKTRRRLCTGFIYNYPEKPKDGFYKKYIREEI